MSEEVRKMFADISARYDVMNTILTFGMHKAWRRKTVRLAGARRGESVLDCASGTGELAIEFKKAVGTSGRVVATDFCAQMLDYVEPKARKLRLDIEVAQADVMNLQFPDNSFDIVSIAYGIRNVDDVFAALAEMIRVLKHNGTLAVLETGQPQGMTKLFYNVFKKLFPFIGKIVAHNKEAYTYLPRTASTFPYADKFQELLRTFPAVVESHAYRLSFGVSYIYIAKIKK